MKLKESVIAMAAFAVASQSLPAAERQRHVETTGDLVELCSVSADDPKYAAAMGFCLGYLDAAMDYHAALTEGPGYRPIVCPEASMTREELKAVFIEWSKRNPQHMTDERPVTGVMRAVVEQWPCTGQ